MRVVVTHKDKGLFLGAANGKLWWTNSPLTIQISLAVTFPNLEAVANYFIQVMGEEGDREGLMAKGVDTEKEYLGVGDLHRFGLGEHCDKLLLFTTPQGFA